MDFVQPWVRRGLATPKELGDWAPDLIAGAQRRGYTAFFLGQMARTRLKDPEMALSLVDQALATERIYQDDKNRFGIERALALADLGQIDQGMAVLREIAAQEKITPFLSGQVRKAIEDLSARGAK